MLRALFRATGKIGKILLIALFYATIGVVFYTGRWLAEWWRKRAAGLPYVQNPTGTHGTAHFADPKKVGLVLSPEKEETAPFLIGYIAQPTGLGRVKSLVCFALNYTITWQLLVGCVVLLLVMVLFGSPELTNSISINFNPAILAALSVIGGGIVLVIYSIKRSKENE